MSIKRNKRIIIIGLLLAVQVFFVSMVGAQDGTVDAKTVERLERLIKQQQQQLESLQQQLNQLKQTATDAQTQAEEAKSVAEETKTAVQAPVARTVTSVQERVKLAISGQVNRAVNLIDDGKNTDLYFVDSDASNTRVRFVGTAKATDDLTLLFKGKNLTEETLLSKLAGIKLGEEKAKRDALAALSNLSGEGGPALSDLDSAGSIRASKKFELPGNKNDRKADPTNVVGKVVKIRKCEPMPTITIKVVGID